MIDEYVRAWPPIPDFDANSVGSLLEIDGVVIVQSGAIASPNFKAGLTGWKIDADGDAEFNSVIVRGTLIAGTGSDVGFDVVTAGTNTAALVVGGSGTVRSSNYSVGTAGWSIEGDGSAEFNNVLIRGDIESSNWNGGSNLGSGIDLSATAGFFVDSSAGAAQFVSGLYVGPSLSDNYLELTQGQIELNPYSSAQWSGTAVIGLDDVAVGSQQFANALSLRSVSGQAWAEVKIIGGLTSSAPLSVNQPIGSPNVIITSSNSDANLFLETGQALGWFRDTGTWEFESLGTAIRGDSNSIDMYVAGNQILRLDSNQVYVGRQPGSASEGGQIEFQGGTSYADTLYIDRYQNGIRFIYGGTAYYQFGNSGQTLLSEPYGADAYRSTAQSIAHQTWTIVVCNNVSRYNKGGDYSTSTGLYTVPTAGFYAFGGSIRMDTAQAFTEVRCGIVHSTGASYEGTWFNDSTGENGPFASTFGMRYLAAGETLALRAYHSNGASATRNTDANNCRFWAVRLT